MSENPIFGVPTLHPKQEAGRIEYIYCNECGGDFVPELHHQSAGKDDDGLDIQIHFFDCPRCGQRYIFYIQDATMEAWAKQRRRLHAELNYKRKNGGVSDTDAKAAFEEIGRLKAQQQEREQMLAAKLYPSAETEVTDVSG